MTVRMSFNDNEHDDTDDGDDDDDDDDVVGDDVFWKLSRKLFPFHLQV